VPSVPVFKGFLASWQWRSGAQYRYERTCPGKVGAKSGPPEDPEGRHERILATAQRGAAELCEPNVPNLTKPQPHRKGSHHLDHSGAVSPRLGSKGAVCAHFQPEGAQNASLARPALPGRRQPVPMPKSPSGEARLSRSCGFSGLYYRRQHLRQHNSSMSHIDAGVGGYQGPGCTWLSGSTAASSGTCFSTKLKLVAYLADQLGLIPRGAIATMVDRAPQLDQYCRG
jgi:hypothetical protein